MTPKVLRFLGDSRVMLRAPGGGLQTCRVGDSFRGWQVMAIISPGGKQLVVLEKNGREEGLLIYVSVSGVEMEIKKPVGKVPELTKSSTPRYSGQYFGALRRSKRDRLAEEVLAQPGDPTWDKVADYLPPVVAETFLGDREMSEKPMVGPNGTVGGHFPCQVKYDPKIPWRHSLLDGHLLAINYAYWDGKQGQEEIAFAVPGPQGSAEVWVRVAEWKGRSSRPTAMTYHKSPPGRPGADAGQFYAQLLNLKRRSVDVLSSGAKIRAPEERVNQACRASILRTLAAFIGPQARYGVGYFAVAKHAGFPPSTIDVANCCLDWGLISQAKEFLTYYLENFVRPDGKFDYYGVAVSEYGQMLEVVARYCRLTKDYRWLKDQLPVLAQIWGHILGERRASRQAVPRGDARYGLIKGLPEADLHESGPYDYFYSGDAWCWRGLLEMSRVLQAAGKKTRDENLTRQGDRLAKEAQAYARDIRRSVANCIVWDSEPPFLPAIAGHKKPYRFLTESRVASYINYRFYPELLGAGVLSPEQASLVIKFREERGGELLGMTRFMHGIDDWPVARYAHALLELDRVEKLLLLYYSHLAHSQFRGTFTDYEALPLHTSGEPVRKNWSYFCVCVQAVIPRLTKWMLVFEERDRELLWLNRAAPRAWFEKGKEIVVERMPTRWGEISYRVESPSKRRISATLRLPDRPFRAAINLRFRHPRELPIKRVVISGRDWTEFDPGSGTITLPPGLKGKIKISAEY